MGNYTVYVNPYLVLRSGGYTKHYYIEGQRIVSKLGSGLDNNGKGQLKAGQDKVNYGSKQQQVREGIVKNLKFLGIDGAVLTAGNSGKTPPGQLKGGKGGNAGGGKDKASEKFQYFYHPDHLGSSSYITDASGEVYQHLEYFAFGETFVEEHSNTHRTPYLFNGKELDEETGLYYYGARYYDARTSIWLAVDPLTDILPGWSPYSYSFNNPLRFTDPTGMMGEDTTDPPTNAELNSAKPGDVVGTEDNGSIMLEGVTITADRLPEKEDQQQNGGSGSIIRNKYHFPPDIDPNSVNPSSIGNVFDIYTGHKNPKSYNGMDSYEPAPANISDAVSRAHDLGYDEKKATGITGVFFNISVLPADARFVKDQYKIVTFYLLSKIDGSMFIDPFTGKPVSNGTAIKSFGAGTFMFVSTFPKHVVNEIGSITY